MIKNRTLILLALIFVATLSSCTSKADRQAAHLRRGQEYFDAHKYREAEIEFRDALQLDQNLVVAHFKLGKTYLAMKDFGHAFSEFRRVVELR